MQKTDNINDENEQLKKKTKKSKAEKLSKGKSTKPTRRNRPMDSSEQNLLPTQIPKSQGFQIIDFHSYEKELTKLILRIPITLISQQQFKRQVPVRIQQILANIVIQKDKQENLSCMIKLQQTNQKKEKEQKNGQVSSEQVQYSSQIIHIWGKCVYISGYQIQNKTIKKARKQVTAIQFNQISKMKIKDVNSDMFICLDFKAEEYVTYEYNGLINQGNTCYMNSYLQMLFHIPAFRNLVYEAQIKDENKFPATLQDLFYKLANSDKAVSPQSLVKSFGWGKKQAHIQQDAQEFSCLFFEALQKKLINSAPQKGYKNMTIQELFKGQLAHYIRCTDVADFRRQNYQQFIDLQIPVSKSLKDSLEEYTSQVHLSGQNKYYTADYGLQQAFKGVKISMFPPILMIQLKRFLYSFELQRNVKILEKFVYPQTFDFSKFGQSASNEQYQLYGVLVHQGSKAQSGHYYNYLKINDSWYKFNDEIVQQVSPQKVFSYNFGGTIETIQFDSHEMKVNPVKNDCKSTAYMLVYVKKQLKSQIFNLKSEYPQWLIKKDANKYQLQQQKKNRKYYFHDISLLNWNHLKDKQCESFQFLSLDYIQMCEKQVFKIDKRTSIQDWIKEYCKNQTLKNKQMIPESQIQMVGQNQKQQNRLGLYAYYVTPQRQTLCGYFHQSNHTMQDLLKNINDPILLIGPSQANKHQYCVIVKKFKFLQGGNVDFRFDNFLIIKKEITNLQILDLLKSIYEGHQKMQMQEKNEQQESRQSYNFYIQDYKFGLIKIKGTNYLLPIQGPNKNHLMIVIAQCKSKKQNSDQLNFQKWYQIQKDIISVILKNEKTSQTQQLKGLNGNLTTSELRKFIFEKVLNKNPQYKSQKNIVIKFKQKKTSKIFSQVTNDPPVKQLVKYDFNIVYSYSALPVQLRVNQFQITFYYRFKNFKFSEPLKIIVERGQSQSDVVKRLKQNEQILQYLKSQGWTNSILLLLTKDKYTINDVVDNQGKIIGKGDLQAVLRKQKNAVLTIEGYQKISSQRIANQEQKSISENISLLVHHISKTGEKIGNPIYLNISKNILLIQLKELIMEKIMNQIYQWEGKQYPCNIFKLKMMLYSKDSKKIIDIAQIQNEQKQNIKPIEVEGIIQDQQSKNNCDQAKSQNQAMDVQKSKEIMNNEEESNTITLLNMQQPNKKLQLKQMQIEQKQEGPKTILKYFPKAKQLKLSIIHNYLAKAIQPLKLHVE